MKILYDENIPYAQEFFAGYGQLQSFVGRTLTPELAADADVLLVRSVTRVNEALLAKNTRLKFVGTATIGTDHIDQHYLKNRQIPFTNAPGCNAISVAEYVISALVVLQERYQFDLTEKTVGIVGAGNTGGRLSERLDALGVNYLLCDPPLAQAGDPRTFVSLDQVLACDIIALHVPLTRDGDYPTYHLLDASRLSQLSDNQVLINACRGEVVDNQALLALKQSGHGLQTVLDVWENEPDVLESLIHYVDITTPHIAGYSLEGKARGTEMLYQALASLLGRDADLSLSDFLPTPAIARVELQQPCTWAQLSELVKLVYDVRRDDAIFRQQLANQGFDSLRKNYLERREFSSLQLALASGDNSGLPYQFGFTK